MRVHGPVDSRLCLRDPRRLDPDRTRVAPMAVASVRWLRRWVPARPSIDLTEGFRASFGALVGIFVTGAVGLVALGSHGGAAWLIAPMGASAVLLFALPSSPLAQPWSIVGGNSIAAVVGVTAARWIGEPSVAAATAIFVAIGLMLALRCLHPPSGAVALVAVLGGADVHAAGYGFVATPVLLNTAAILITALVYNNLTGRRYPHDQGAESAARRATGGPRRIGFDDRDVRAALTRYNEVVDVSVDDLGALLRLVENTAFRRRHGELRCGDVMHRDVASVEFGTELADAWDTMRDQAVPALPVVDRFAHVIGIVTRGDLLRHADGVDTRATGARFARLLRRTEGASSDKPEVVGQIMTAPVRTAIDSTPVVELVSLFTDGHVHHAPIVDAQNRLVGIVEQADVIAALYETILTHDASLHARTMAA